MNQEKLCEIFSEMVVLKNPKRTEFFSSLSLPSYMRDWLVKLLYPHARNKEDIPPDEFEKYCLLPAKEMRAAIKKQLCIVDPREFNVAGKREIPDIKYKY